MGGRGGREGFKSRRAAAGKESTYTIACLKGLVFYLDANFHLLIAACSGCPLAVHSRQELGGCYRVTGTTMMDF